VEEVTVVVAAVALVGGEVVAGMVAAVVVTGTVGGVVVTGVVVDGRATVVPGA